jgi:hypothetical protein
MGHARIMAGELRNAFSRYLSFQLIEIGAGGGEFMLNVARRLRGTWRRVDLTLVDRLDVVETATREKLSGLKWQVELVRKDARQWLRNGAPERAEAIVANLFLHQFSDDEVREMLAGAARKARVVAVLEPRRSRAALLLSRCLWLLGCNAVTRHDAPVSVRAGFTGTDLSTLWPDAENWELTERPAGWCSHLFVAQRKETVACRNLSPSSAAGWPV